MATYKEIQNWVRSNYEWTPKTCWIAHCKELFGLPVRTAPNRYGSGRIEPCPEDRRDAIYEAFRYFRMLQ